MRSPLRSLLASALFAVSVLGVAASGALAASATPGRFTSSDAWCFDDVVLQYCFDNQHTVRFIEFADGDGWVSISSREQTVVYRDGAIVGQSTTVSQDRSIYVDGGLATLREVSHTKYAGEGVTCTSTYLLRITDFELQMERWNGPGCA